MPISSLYAHTFSHYHRRSAGLYFATTDSLLFNKFDQNGLPASLSSIPAGAITGALFRSPRGPRQALVAGCIGAVAGAGIIAARQVFPSL